MVDASIQCRVNGEAVEFESHPMARLLDVLRRTLHLTGTKEGCGEGECGACAVLLDGRLVNSCLVPALHASGAEIVTIEGVAGGGALHAVQQAFVTHGGAQCGICTPGMVLASMALLERTPNPTDAEIRDGLAGNLCRCTGYTRIFEAVAAACRTLAKAHEPRECARRNGARPPGRASDAVGGSAGAEPPGQK